MKDMREKDESDIEERVEAEEKRIQREQEKETVKNEENSEVTNGKAEEQEEEKPEEPKVLAVGDEIPSLVLKNQDDEDVDLHKIATENRIVAFFLYPKASTPGCTTQACGYSANYDSLKDKAKIYGLSSDLPKAQKNFIEKHELRLDGLLCDPEKKFIGPLGAKKLPNGIKRSHFIFVDGKLKVARVQVSPAVSIEDGKKEIEELYQSLQDSTEAQ